MDDVQINLLAFFGIIETLLVLLAVSTVFILRSRSLSARVRSLQGQLKQAADQPQATGFAQYLRDEVVRNQAMLDAASAASGPEEKQAAEWLTIRRGFLELEVAARELENNPVQFQAALTQGLEELVAQWSPQDDAEEVECPVQPPQAGPEAGNSEDESAAPDTAAAPLDTSEQEFERLKQVILNQQDAMSALRSELQARETDIEDLDGIMRKLDEFERHDAELQQCLRMLEEENRQLKSARDSGRRNGDIESMDPEQLSGLKDMIGNQQTTISNLQQLIHELAPEAGKVEELSSAIESIQRANQELNGCVAVLEDENAMLRAELDAVNEQLQRQDDAPPAGGGEPDLAVMDDEPEEPDDEKEQLAIKVQELEALVEFKDAAIEELEKQYNTLESKYLALTGEK